jgi:hypothetical protein
MHKPVASLSVAKIVLDAFGKLVEIKPLGAACPCEWNQLLLRLRCRYLQETLRLLLSASSKFDR